LVVCEQERFDGADALISWADLSPWGADSLMDSGGEGWEEDEDESFSDDDVYLPSFLW